MPPRIKAVGMLGLQGERIDWGQLELNAGRIDGKDCVALYSLKMIKNRKDCVECISAATLQFTEDISNQIEDSCAQALQVTEQMTGRFWTVGYSENGTIYQYRSEKWERRGQTSEHSGQLLIFKL